MQPALTTTPTPVVRSMIRALALAWLALSPAAAFASALAAPGERVVLRITGNLERTNDGDAAAFDLAQLGALPQTTVKTVTPWTEGVTEFRGPLAREVLGHVKARGIRVRATAINDYVIEIPIADFDSYDVILAIARDGKPMGIRDRGPIWVIYPWSEHPELQNEVYHGRSIWQLESLVVE